MHFAWCLPLLLASFKSGAFSLIIPIIPTNLPNEREYSDLCTTTTKPLLPFDYSLMINKYLTFFTKSKANCLIERQICFDQNRYFFCEQVGEQGEGNDQFITGLFECFSPFCESEEFKHLYITRTSQRTPHLNKWKRAEIGERSTLQDLCLLSNGMPVSRECRMGDYGVEWESTDQWEPVVCLSQVKEKTISKALNSLHDDILKGRQILNDTQGREEMVDTLTTILQQSNRTLLPADVLITGQIFKSLVAEEKEASIGVNLVSICTEIMSSDSKVLRLSAKLNATNNLLSEFESYMDALPEQLVPTDKCGMVVTKPTGNVTVEAATGVETHDFSDIGVQAQINGNISVFFTNPECDEITGIAIFSTQAEGRRTSFNGFWYRFLRFSEELDTVKRESDLETAAFLPENLWREVKSWGITYIIFKVYAHDALFVENSKQRNRRPRSKIISISIPELKNKSLPLPLLFLLRNENLRDPDTKALSLDSGCGYWNYETWLSEGVTTTSSSDLLTDPIIECHTYHLTQFAFLVGGSYRNDDLAGKVLITPIEERVLDIISIVGCSLSLLGVLGIFLTAALFKSWRSQASTKVLLHLCLAMSLQMVLFVFLNTDDISEQLVVSGDKVRCVALGAALQYSILVLFSWMLIIAYLQYQRYVMVIGVQRPRNYILKAAFIAWFLPVIPTLLVAFIDPDSYLPSAAQLSRDSGICYPSGHGLIFGVVLPVGLIIVANLVTFVKVFYSISHSLSQSKFKSDRKILVQEIRLSILLFFLLGLTWIFGILAFLQGGVAFSYLFCTTATLQGFVMFVYFVVLDKTNRKSWMGLVRPLKMKMDVQKRTAELHSIPTSSTYTSRSNY